MIQEAQQLGNMPAAHQAYSAACERLKEVTLARGFRPAEVRGAKGGGKFGGGKFGHSPKEKVSSRREAPMAKAAGPARAREKVVEAPGLVQSALERTSLGKTSRSAPSATCATRPGTGKAAPIAKALPP